MASPNPAGDLWHRLLDGVPSTDDIETLSQRLFAIQLDVVREVAPRLCHAVDTGGVDYEGFSQRFHDFVTQGDDPNLVTARLLSGALAVLPEVVLPLGYDEVRYSVNAVTSETLSNSASGAFAESAAEYAGAGVEVFGVRFERPAGACPDCSRRIALACSQAPQYRQHGGLWVDLEAVLDDFLPIIDPSDAEGGRATLTQWIWLLQKQWTDRVGDLPSAATMSMPALTATVGVSDTLLHVSVRELLFALATNHVGLRDLHWRDLEEVVAEVLRGLGLRVSVTPLSNDGGRDIVARGELVTGEPMLLAVEVKHRPVVHVRDVRQALWANRHYPAVMVATSGRFSAGVLREKRNPDVAMRLYLKDGVSLTQWIDAYARQRAQGVRGG